VAVSLYKSIAAGLLWVVSRKNQNHRRDVREARRRAVSFILSNLDQRLVRKKNSGKKKAVATTTTRSTCDWSEILTKAKGSERKKAEIRNEFIIILG